MQKPLAQASADVHACPAAPRFWHTPALHHASTLHPVSEVHDVVHTLAWQMNGSQLRGAQMPLFWPVLSCEHAKHDCVHA